MGDENVKPNDVSDFKMIKLKKNNVEPMFGIESWRTITNTKRNGKSSRGTR